MNRFSRKGFTLIEIIIAMLLLAFAATGIFAGFVSSKRYTKLAYHRLQALNLARQTLESLRMEVDARTWDTSANNLSEGVYFPGNFTGSDNTEFNVSYNATNLTGFGGDGPRQVTITVAWEER